MKDGTREDYLLLLETERAYAQGLPDRLLEALRRMDHTLEGYPITRLGHSLQAATRARHDGADDDLLAAALLHDIGDELALYNHAELAAAILRPYVRPEVTWVVAQHGLFQSYYYAHHYGGDRHARSRYQDHPWYHACAHFCAAWDQSSFDPDYANDSLESFEPLLRRVFSRPPKMPGDLPTA
jgi:predicted HD phosphohydrolase